MKKTITPLLTGFLFGVAAAVILDAILSPNEPINTPVDKPESLESLNRKRIVAESEERYLDAAVLRDAINKIKYNGNTN